ncbi:OpgC domain-containing protein [Edwardsiella anguillarum]|nr:OpgC domain-containing protein [Edwardsiella anguillarum]WHP78841.1 OpgC domain-containing protein [Edwardsiella anguillarum]WHQ15591.1 OpgC domain-containing protein [Edwardsiella anguillarum]WHQ16246.1 OpgC domain-containing protein [Edwardsiella anguillarum]WHQ19779.1 OpgC domain-containing protein [Edwardsiella anguillarum]WHQ23302.1 OpgC domain-containing protein [Edwardsiella anguillarum]
MLLVSGATHGLFFGLPAGIEPDLAGQTPGLGRPHLPVERRLAPIAGASPVPLRAARVSWLFFTLFLHCKEGGGAEWVKSAMLMTGIRREGGKGLGYLRRWRYVPDGPRDLRIDFMRGMALMLMIVTHVEIISVFNLFTSERFGFTTGAEIFVILSGFVLGQTKRRQLQHSDMATVSYSLLRRAATLYAVNIVIIVSVLALSQLPWLNSFEVTHFTQRHDELIYSLYPIAAQSREAWFNQILFLQIGPQQTQILGLYFYLLLGTPLVVWMLQRGYGGALFIISLELYIAYQLYPVDIIDAQFEYAFPPLAWQFIYTLGLMCGWYKGELQSLAKTLPGKRVIGLMIAVFLVLFFVIQNNTNPFIPARFFLHVLPDYRFDYINNVLAGKNELGLLRVVNDACLLLALYLLLSYLWLPISRAVGWFFILMGQNSLYVFILHLYVVMAISQWVRFGLWQHAWLENTLTHGLALAVLWLMARFGILRRIVPN